MLGVTIPSIIATEFPDNQELYIGYAGMSMGAGLCFGPVIGSLVFRWLNYVQTFYFFTIYMFFFGLLTVFFIPSKVNRSDTR
jgi:MFS family permease